MQFFEKCFSTGRDRMVSAFPHIKKEGRGVGPGSYEKEKMLYKMV